MRAEAAAILAARKILTPRTIELVAAYEQQGSLTAEQAEEFVREALETFRWHGEATVTAETYNRLNDAHRLIAAASALAMAADAALKGAMGESVKDAYKALKEKVATWAGGDVEALVCEPESKGRQIIVAEKIDKPNARRILGR